MLSTFRALVRIALANLFSSFLNVFVGAVLAFGAALLVVGGSLFSTLDQSLSRSIVGSITGHLQVYAARSKHPLEVYGRVDGSDSTLAPLDDFKALKAKLLQVPNVARVVPMGSCSVLVSSGNTVDVTLEKLRSLYRNQEAEATKLPDGEFRRQADSVKAHVRYVVGLLATDARRATELARLDEEDLAVQKALTTASSDAFWAGFDEDPFGHLELLENKVAPEVGDSDMLFIRLLGTDLDAYQQTFDRLAIVEGTQVPRGQRGVLLPRFFVEEFLKLKNARRLDKLKEARAVGRTIATDKELQRLVRENQAQTREVVLQLDGLRAAEATRRLQAFLGENDPDLGRLLSHLLAVDDATFDARYAFFYESLAPLVTLYRAKVGDSVTVRTIGKSGGVEAATVKVYGIFELKGLEKSPLAGINGLVDIVTFRELYGYLSAERKAELEELKKATGAREVSRESAEAELFGGEAELEAEAKAADLRVEPALRKVERRSETYEPEEIDDGVVLHAAVMLKDGSTLAQLQTLAEVEQVLAAERPAVDAKAVAAAEALLASGRLPFTLAQPLGAALAVEQGRAKGEAATSTAAVRGLEDALRAQRRLVPAGDVAVVDQLLASAKPRVWVVDWATAAGYLGQFILFFRLLLVAVVVAFAFIALVVVTIGVTIATLQRTQTIGTMRAIGAQREFVVGMVLVETMVLAVVFGLAGAAVGSGLVAWMHSSGIPAFRDELYFFFSGPVLRPELTPGALALALVATMGVSLLSVLFPVILATRVSPLTAMQTAE